MQEILRWKRYPIATRAPNVFYVEHVDHAPNNPDARISELHKRITDIALKAALQQPEWLFLIDHLGGEYSTNLYVFYADEHIGSVGFESVYTKHCVWDYRLALTSKTIRREASRKNNIGTDNDKRALKMVLEKFVPTPMNARLFAKASSATVLAKQKVYSSLHYSSDGELTPDRVHSFLSDRGLWEEFAAYAVADGADPNLATNLPPRLAAMKVSQQMEKVVNAGKAETVVVHDGVYRVYQMGRQWAVGQDIFVKYTAAELPDKLRGSIGMLKVAAEGTVVPGVGVCVEGAFILTGGD